ncbi:hypothetical protein V6N12_063417 [Hibiscus sabdariffa]|uniref:Uncharacterized protein n=1 Tax=Hibiscus sabdariffa TaxID=183260 RepID=A0ABR2FBS2_9ROSI
MFAKAGDGFGSSRAEQFPLLPSTKRTMTTSPTKSQVTENGSQCPPVIKFGVYECPFPTGMHSPAPVLTESRLCTPSIEKQKQKELCELKRPLGEPFQLQDNKDFPPLLSM